MVLSWKPEGASQVELVQEQSLLLFAETQLQEVLSATVFSENNFSELVIIDFPHELQ